MTSPATQQILVLREGSIPVPGKKKLTPSDAEALAQLRVLLVPAIPTEVFITYWRFACERQCIFFRRFGNESAPWTVDPVLAQHRFTNVYRAADRVSQYLISQVQYRGDWSGEDLFFRTLLFKFFNRISTWKLLTGVLGEPEWKKFSCESAARTLDIAMAGGERIYSAAYIMPSGGPRSGHRRKHRMHLALIKQMMSDQLPAKVARAKTMQAAFELLRSYPTIGDFLAYQYVTDLNYSELIDFTEREFVVAGPGAKEGIEKCFSSLGGKDSTWVIQRVADIQDAAFAALGLSFQKLGKRPLQYIDCQNLFCEVAKYARVRHPEFNSMSGRTRIKQKFVALGEPIAYTFPPKWELPSLALPYRHVACD